MDSKLISYSFRISIRSKVLPAIILLMIIISSVFVYVNDSYSVWRNHIEEYALGFSPDIGTLIIIYPYNNSYYNYNELYNRYKILYNILVNKSNIPCVTNNSLYILYYISLLNIKNKSNNNHMISIYVLYSFPDEFKRTFPNANSDTILVYDRVLLSSYSINKVYIYNNINKLIRNIMNNSIINFNNLIILYKLINNKLMLYNKVFLPNGIYIVTSNYTVFKALTLASYMNPINLRLNGISFLYTIDLRQNSTCKLKSPDNIMIQFYAYINNILLSLESNSTFLQGSLKLPKNTGTDSTPPPGVIQNYLQQNHGFHTPFLSTGNSPSNTGFILAFIPTIFMNITRNIDIYGKKFIFTNPFLDSVIVAPIVYLLWAVVSYYRSSISNFLEYYSTIRGLKKKISNIILIITLALGSIATILLYTLTGSYLALTSIPIFLIIYIISIKTQWKRTSILVSALSIPYILIGFFLIINLLLNKEYNKPPIDYLLSYSQYPPIGVLIVILWGLSLFFIEDYQILSRILVDRFLSPLVYRRTDVMSRVVLAPFLESNPGGVLRRICTYIISYFIAFIMFKNILGSADFKTLLLGYQGLFLILSYKATLATGLIVVSVSSFITLIITINYYYINYFSFLNLFEKIRFSIKKSRLIIILYIIILDIIYSIILGLLLFLGLTAGSVLYTVIGRWLI